MRFFVALLTLTLTLGIAAAAPDPTSAQARSAYDEGITNYNLGHYDEALASFERGYRLKHDPAFLFNIGQCQRQLDRPRDAARSFRAYLREVADAPNRADVEKLITSMDEQAAQKAANQPPTGNQPPTTVVPPPSPPASAATSPAAAPVAVTASAPPPRKRTALWIGIGVGAAVVIGLAVGLGVGLGTGHGAPSTTLGSMPVSF